MRRVLVVLATVLLLAGCGGGSGSPSNPNPDATTFTNREHHFYVTYDPSNFEVSTRVPAQQEFALLLRLRKADAAWRRRLVSGSDFCFVGASAPVEHWSSVAPLLVFVVQSFTVTKQ